MKPLTDKQKKAAWIVAFVLVFIHFLPDMIHAAQRSFSSHRQSAPAAPRVPVAVPIPQVSQVSDAVQPPALPLDAQARFLGIWEGQSYAANNTTCKLHLELRLSPDKPGYVSGYESRACFNIPQFVNSAPKGGFQQALRDYTPVATVMLGSYAEGDLTFRVDNTIGTSPFQCPLTSYAVSPFGQQAIVAQWRTNCSTDAQLVLARVRG
jgi:hypothetical protein